jgi:hypothetical protein
MPTDPELRSHQEWLGMVQPVGLVAFARALAAAGAFIDRAGLIGLQQKFESLTEQKRDEDPILPDLSAFCFKVLGWEPSDLAGAPGGPELRAPRCRLGAVPGFVEFGRRKRNAG